MRCTISQIYLISTLHVADSSTVYHQEYLNTVYTQQVFVMLLLLVSASYFIKQIWQTVHLVHFYYENISRCTVLWMSHPWSKSLRSQQFLSKSHSSSSSSPSRHFMAPKYSLLCSHKPIICAHSESHKFSPWAWLHQTCYLFSSLATFQMLEFSFSTNSKKWIIYFKSHQPCDS